MGYTMKLMHIIFGFFFLCLFSFNTAYGFELYYSNAHPYMAHNMEERGFLSDLVIEAAKKENINIDPVFIPWKRAQIVAQKGANKLIFVVRTPKREGKYTWITPLFNMQTVIATTNKKVNSIKDAKATLESLTVMRGIALQRYVLAKGYPENKLLTLPINKRLINFLSQRPKAGWIAQKMQIKSYWALFAKDIPLVLGDVITERKLWLACSKDCPHIETEKLAQSITELKKSNWYRKRKNFYITQSSQPSFIDLALSQ